MYQIGDKIVYGGEGVCLVEAVGPLDIPGSSQERLYYTLAPLYRSGRIYAPVDSTVCSRPVLTRTEAEALVRRIPDIEPPLCEGWDLRTRSDHYRQLLQSQDCTSMVQVIKAVFQKRQAAKKGRLGQVDERYMRRAEDLLYGELAVSLELTPDQVPAYIRDSIEGAALPSANA